MGIQINGQHPVDYVFDRIREKYNNYVEAVEYLIDLPEEHPEYGARLTALLKLSAYEVACLFVEKKNADHKAKLGLAQ